MTRSTLEELLARCERATTANFQLEQDIGSAFDASYPAPAYTASYDAIEGLIERELPDWRFDFHSPRNGQTWEAVLSEHGESRRVCVGHAANGPLALCCAFLKAKLSSGGDE